MTADPRVEPLPEHEFTRVMAVVAHPDDMEYGASAAVHRWTGNGIEVAYLLLTSGEAGMKTPPEQVGPLRAAEQRKACALVGVEKLTILEHPDGTLMPNLGLRRDIAREIRAFRPDVVLTMTWDIETPWGYNQADHRAAGLATLDACRDAGNPWVFPTLVSEGYEPWSPTWLLVFGGAPRFGVVVSDADVAAAVASLSAHEAYLADLPDHPKPAEFIPEALHNQGRALGAHYGVVFSGQRLG